MESACQQESTPLLCPVECLGWFFMAFGYVRIFHRKRLPGKRYMPFSDFQRFQEDDMPFNSDVVLIISQYIKCLEKFKYDNVKRLSGNWYWNLSDTDEEVKTSHPIMDLVM